MTLWVDAQLPPGIAAWVQENFPVTAAALRDIGLRDAEDEEIFAAAKAASVVVMTKDSDFRDLLDRLGPPPQVIWVTCGNTSNARLKEILTATLPEAPACWRRASGSWRSAAPDRPSSDCPHRYVALSQVGFDLGDGVGAVVDDAGD